jgi:hypothetical protein
MNVARAPDGEADSRGAISAATGSLGADGSEAAAAAGCSTVATSTRPGEEGGAGKAAGGGGAAKLSFTGWPAADICPDICPGPSSADMLAIEPPSSLRATIVVPSPTSTPMTTSAAAQIAVGRPATACVRIVTDEGGNG